MAYRRPGQSPWLGLMALAAALLAPLATSAAPAPGPTAKTAHLELELGAESTAVQPGGTVYLALHQKIAKGWHTYWRNPGDAGEATTADWKKGLPAGWKAGDFVWPTPERAVTGPLMNYVYSDEVTLPFPVEVPASAVAGQAASLTATFHLLVCKDVCVPEDATLSIKLPVSAGVAAPDPRYGKLIAATLAAAPKPAGAKATFWREGQVLKLSIAGGAARAGVKAAGVAHAYFYPFAGSVIDHAKPQKAQAGKEGLTLTLPAGYDFTHGKVVNELAGVISLDRTHSFEIKALPGKALADAAGVGPELATTLDDGKGPAGGVGGGASGIDLAALLSAAGSAFLGGLILNLMPCVFPVLAIKAAALARHNQLSHGQARMEGLLYLAGVLATFLVLAGAVIIARAAGQSVGWGFQLQSPGVVAALALVMLAVALNLSGVFEIGLSLQGLGSGLAQHGGAVGAFFTGVLAVAVAAPCLGPFLGASVGWAFTQPPAATLAVFAAIGLGLASPFVAIAFVPAVARLLPKPGAWMDGLKKALAFPMYGAAAWLAWVFARETGVDGLPFLFAAAIVLSLSVWLWGASQRGVAPALMRALAALAFIAATPLAWAGSQMTPPADSGKPSPSQATAGGVAIEPWSPERVAALQAEGRPVFVDFTAAWCVTCQVNERAALASAAVKEAFARDKAVYLKADWTNRDPGIAKALEAQGRSGVPLYLVYGKAPQPAVLPQLLSEGIVVEALDNAAHG